MPDAPPDLVPEAAGVPAPPDALTDAPPDALTAAKLSGSGFSLVNGVHGARRTTIRRTWLDTFDWRLYRAGLTLEQVTGRGGTELRLTGRDGTGVAAEQFQGAARGRAPRWPGQPDALPAGPLAERLASVVGVRALLPVARATSAVREQRALNDDAKTIARVTADQMSVTYPAAAQLPERLAVSAVRGYQAQASRLAGLLAALPGVTTDERPALEAVLAAAGRRAGDYSGRIDVQLTAGMPAATAMASVFTTLLGMLEANVPGTISDLDTEFLHDLRVSVRRTRSALKLAGQVLPRGVRARFQPEFKWLGDLTTPTRDLDVYLLGLPDMTARLVGADEADLEPFGDHLRRARGRAQRELAGGLRSARFGHLCRDWRDALDEAAATTRRRPTAEALAASSIAAVHRRVLTSGAVITAVSPPESLHDLRKRCKELRYLLEIFASLHAPSVQWRAVQELKGLQDCLGEFQDTDVQRAELRAFAVQMMDERRTPAQTLLAMGEIAAGLARRQRRARSQFAGLFADFASPAGRARIAALTRQAVS
ncbi:MAG TPA: CHAD domain-containing protein [Streptosporangiaceae bacterium]|nr:CHAD domain-containing protein [Streptosporangiaceae bacterium]